eukprot:6176746-Pleurochrysis_carterae.AAC.4
MRPLRVLIEMVMASVELSERCWSSSESATLAMSSLTSTTFSACLRRPAASRRTVPRRARRLMSGRFVERSASPRMQAAREQRAAVAAAKAAAVAAMSAEERKAHEEKELEERARLYQEKVRCSHSKSALATPHVRHRRKCTLLCHASMLRIAIS